MFIEQPWNLSPRLDSTISLIYLGVFSTGIAWLLRFYILKNNGLVFQAQVAYLIPIFGVILGFLFLKEEITPKVILSVIAVIIGIYLVKRSSKVISNWKKIYLSLAILFICEGLISQQPPNIVAPFSLNFFAYS